MGGEEREFGKCKNHIKDSTAKYFLLTKCEI
jgi:hypothetical protein